MSAIEPTSAPASSKDAEAGWRELWLEVRRAQDYPAIQRLVRARRKLTAAGPPPSLPVTARVAILGGATTDLLMPPLTLALEAIGVECALHAAPFNTFAREMLDPSSATVAFRPDVAVLVTTPANIPSWPAWDASEEAVARAVDEVCGYWLGLCRSLHDNAKCDVVLGNFHALSLTPFGTAGVRFPGEPNRFLRAVNEALARRAPAYVHIHDVAALAALHGVERWFDQRFWFHAKQPVSFECLVPYVRSLAHLIGALFGQACKCVVVDLDNTLWGGVVGDDGPDRLVLGEGDPRGEAFVAFQRYLQQLNSRGVLLAVCSKNDEAQALAPFASRPEMVLRREDFAAFRANWRPKSENLREIAMALNIGLDALVYVDDNPAEREQVRQALPEIRVVDAGEDPAEFAIRLDRTGWLDQVVLSAEDRSRAAMYAANSARSEVRAQTTDYGAYLRSLEQRAVIAPFDEPQLDRITQLTNKTNQFNLTTRRLSRSELGAMMSSPDYVTMYVRLADRFGDNGLIAVLAARGEGTDLWIDLWLMSCRVFSRGVEQLTFSRLVDQAQARGYRRVHGLYLPTAKNSVVRDLYRTLGFSLAGSLDGGEHWTLEVDGYTAPATSITIVPDY